MLSDPPPPLPAPPSRAPGCAPPGPAATATIEVVVPVFNEEAAIETSIRALHRHLRESMPYGWSIVIADNASTDATPVIARRLAASLDAVRVLRLERKGRGHALATAWGASRADVCCYMDVDLSTDLRALPVLIAPLVSGHSDLAIGTRLARGARVTRGPKREVISRAYNGLLRLSLQAGFSDAQCGFKAIRADAARRLLPLVRDGGWFFDTELLVLAQRAGLRIHEVPVDWVDDPDSRVDIVATALADLRGIARLLGARPVVRFGLIGVASTIAYALLYLLARGPLGQAVGDALALAVTAVANTQANRRWTFGIRGRRALVRQHVAGAVVYLIALGLTLGALDLVDGLLRRPPRGLEVAVLVGASALATVIRYVALRSWVFHRARLPSSAPSAACRA